MSNFKFIHAADLHIDSPLKGLDKYDGAPVDEIRSATRRAFENLVELAIKEEVAFVLLAGDIYDGTWRDHNTGLYFVSQMADLNEAGIKVFMVSGNHDAESKITKQLQFPDNVAHFPSNKPLTIKIDELECAIHGQSFIDASVSENLAVNYPAPITNYLNIGVLHTSVEGREWHDPYAPCTLSDLKGKGYDYWALGHIHKREVLSEDPYVVFPGNIQGRHARETGEKGCTVVAVEDDSIVSVEHENLDVLRWLLCEIDATEFETLQEILDAVGEDLKEKVQSNINMPLVVRISVSGVTNLHYKLVQIKDEFVTDCRAQAIGIPGADIWVEKVIVNTSAQSAVEAIAMDEDTLASIQERTNNMIEDDGLLDIIIDDLSDFNKQIPEELKQTDEEEMLFDKGSIKKLLKEAGDLITGHLSGGKS